MKLIFARFLLIGVGVGIFISPQKSWAAKKENSFSAFTKGVEHSAKKRYADAVMQLQKAIEQRPQFYAAYQELARALVLWGKRRDGLEVLERGIKTLKNAEERERLVKERAQLAEVFYTNSTFQKYQNGLNYLRLDRVGAAVSSFEQALSIEPDNVAILVAYAQAIQLEEGWDGASKALELAYKLQPERRETRTMLAELVLKKQPERSLQLLRPLLLEAPKEEAAWILQLRAMVELKREKEALEILRLQTEKNPRWYMAHYWLGKNYALRPDDAWLARKHLLTFLKREESQTLPKQIREDAELMLNRVNKSLE